MTAYYNEIDKFAAATLRNLIAAGLIAPGDVDERDIRDVRPSDLRGYTQCHFFAGVGVWSYGMRRAGWPDDRRGWTGSCPCQPFSSAGRGAGFADERHLWPAFFHLIRECRPDVVFGEQVASKDGLAWIDLVLADLEGEDYAGGAFDLCAAGFGAPHIRQRLYWMADAAPIGHAQRRERAGDQRDEPGSRPALMRRDDVGGLAHAHHHGFQGGAVAVLRGTGRREEGDAAGRGGASLAERSGLADADGRDASTEGLQRGGQQRQQQEDGRTRELGDTDGRGSSAGQQTAAAARQGSAALTDGCGDAAGPTNGHWRDPDWLLCRDGKWRPVESGTFPLAHGAATRVGRLRAYGNAIVAQQAEEFVRAYLDTEHLRLSLASGVFA